MTGRRASKERRGGVEVMWDKPRWNSDGAKFGKRGRRVCGCQETC